MGAKKKTKSKKSKQTSLKCQSGGALNSATFKGANGEDLINVSPSRVRFQHSKIRPYFSGCGRSVAETLDEIRRGSLEPGDLPPIQVLAGPDENDGLGPWYFSLNNRRLWVLKQCHKEGLLDNERYNNTIPVRVRIPKSQAEADRYSVENCALEAKFMREGGSGREGKSTKKKGKGKGEVPCAKDRDSDSKEKGNNGRISRDNDENDNKSDKSEDVGNSDHASDSESVRGIVSDNPFSALF